MAAKHDIVPVDLNKQFCFEESQSHKFQKIAYGIVSKVVGYEGWWVDTGATRHVCYDRSLFKTYSVAESHKVLDSHTIVVAGTRKVELKFTSRKTVVLKDVMHTQEMRKNLVSDYLLNKAGFTHTIGVDLYTFTKNNVFVGKDYATDGMFKLNLVD